MERIIKFEDLMNPGNKGQIIAKSYQEFINECPVDTNGFIFSINDDIVSIQTIEDSFSDGGMKFDSDKTRFTLVPVTYFYDLFEHPRDSAMKDNSQFQVFTDILSEYQDIHEDLSDVTEYINEVFHMAANGRSEQELFIAIADLYSFGAKKYADNSWKGVSVDRYIDALGRHIIKGSENIDDDSGMKHWVHILWNCIAVYYLIRNKDEK